MLKAVQKQSRHFATRTTKRGKKAAAASSDNGPSSGVDGFRNMTHPKLQLHGLDSRYANALYSVASKEKKLQVVEKELLQFQQLVSDNASFKEFLKNPTIPRHQKKADMEGVMKEGKFSKHVAGLFSVLAENGRLPNTAGIISSYQSLMSAHRGEVKATVVSADKLSSAQLKQVEGALNKKLEKGEKLMLETKVNPDILGGLQVHIGTMFIDLSVVTKMNKLHSLLKAPVQ